MSVKTAWKKFFNSLIFSEILIILLVIVTWAVIFHFVEWLSFFHSIYFVMTTMATIWYWDITPHTDLWRVFVIIYAFLWVPLFISISWLILESRFNKHIKKYINRLNRELHQAEQEIEQVEKNVQKELWSAIWKSEHEIEKIEWEVGQTKKEVRKTEKEVEKIEDVIYRKPRWKKIFLK